MQYSSRTMLIVAVVAAVLLTCLVYPDPIVGDIAYTCGLLLIAFGTIGAIYVRGRQRAFLVGFLVVFGSYYYASLWTTETRLSLLAYQQGGMRYVSSSLITSRLLASAYEGLHPTAYPRVNGPFPRASPSDQIVGRYLAYMTIGHSIIGLVLGILGGWLALRLAPAALPVTERTIDEILDEMERQ
ncbi:MAG TPA: hypothetical protein VHE81_09740 [Lacipirellulaceae bacterium]|nr:hypothetical protein [Lacipirellulaceae bacterium]